MIGVTPNEKHSTKDEGRLSVHEGDITTLAVDAIVNSANRSLLGGGGIDRAIHRAAGRELLLACIQLGGCPVGSAKLTPGFRLSAQYVIHAVAPPWTGGRNREEALLMSAYRSALDLAVEKGLRSVALPCLSRGIHRYPLEAAAEVAWNVVLGHAYDGRVIFAPYGEYDVRLYEWLLLRWQRSHEPTLWSADVAVAERESESGRGRRIKETATQFLCTIDRPEEPFETAAWLIAPRFIRRVTKEALQEV